MARNRNLLPPYTFFAEYYAVHIAPYLYDSWKAVYESLVSCRKFTNEACADVACGPGFAAEYLARRFRMVYAVDISPEMLRLAGKRTKKDNVVLLRQDMRFLQLPIPVSLISCWGDSLNHLTKEDDLIWAFRSFALNLVEGGYLFFDFNLEGQLREGAGEDWYGMEIHDGRACWRLCWDEDKGMALMEVTFLDRWGTKIGREVIREKAYPTEWIMSVLERAGFTPLEWVDAATLREPGEKTRRIAILATNKRIQGISRT